MLELTGWSGAELLEMKEDEKKEGTRENDEREMAFEKDEPERVDDGVEENLSA